jgi:hypothetical protein
MLATDPLSLVFLGCIVFAGAFLLISAISGIGHGAHLGHLGHLGHIGHIGHIGHVGSAGHVGAGGHAGAAHGAHPGPASHAGQAGQAGHAGHAGHAGAQTGPGSGGATPLASAWAAVSNALLGSLNLFGVLTFLFVFGLGGYLLHGSTNLGVFLTLFLPALTGVAAAVGISIPLTRLFNRDIGLLTAENSRLEGRLGKVSRTIRVGGVGEVIFERQGAGRQSIGARGLDNVEIPVDAEIVIVGIRDGIATVQTWDAFMRSVRAGKAPILEALEPGPEQHR